MEKDKQSTPDIDVTDEKYEGPSAHIVALGDGVIKHLKWAFIGIAGGTLYALIDREHAGSIIKYFRDSGNALKIPIAKSESFFAKAKDEFRYTLGALSNLLFGDKEMANELRNVVNLTDTRKIDWLKNSAMAKEHGFGYFFISHAVGIIPGLGRITKNHMRIAAESSENIGKVNALTFGGAFGAVGYVSGWIAALVTGAQHGNSGKHQFIRAKKQIKNLQEDNADLNKINNELHEKYVKAATRLDSMQAAQENAARETTERSELPAIKEMGSAAPAQTPAPTNEVQLSQNQHDGKLAQQDLAPTVA